MHQHQALGQRHPDVVLELLWGRAGSALGAVDDDEVRGDAGGEHALADGQELGAGAHAELEADRLAAGEPAQRRDERHHLAVGVPNAVCAGGDTTVRPCGTPRVAAISALTLGPGSTPPSPGLAPCDSLIEIALTAGSCAFSANFAASKLPSVVAAAEVPRTDLPDQVAAGRAGGTD